MFGTILGGLKALGSIFDAIGRIAEWFREWQARRAAEEAGATKERDRARTAAEADEAKADEARRQAERKPVDEPDEFERKS